MDPSRLLLVVNDALSPLDVALGGAQVDVEVEVKKHEVSIVMVAHGAAVSRSALIRVHVYWISLLFSTKVGTMSVDDVEDLDETEVIDRVRLYTRIAAAWLTGADEPWGGV